MTMQKHSHLWENPISIHAWTYLNLLDYIHWVGRSKKYFLDRPLPLCLTGDFAPMGGMWCCSLLLRFSSGTAQKPSDRSCWACAPSAPLHGPSPSPVPSTLGSCWLSPALLQRRLNCRQRHYKRQRPVQVSVRPLSYSSVCLRPLRAMTTQLALDYPFIATFRFIIELNNWLFL